MNQSQGWPNKAMRAGLIALASSLLWLVLNVIAANLSLLFRLTFPVALIVFMAALTTGLILLLAGSIAIIFRGVDL
jgi:uncharacterized integral membrane protein